LSECIAKLNASNRIDAARIAQQKGWLEIKGLERSTF